VARTLRSVLLLSVVSGAFGLGLLPGCTTDNDFLAPGDPTVLDALKPVDTFRALDDPHLWGTARLTWVDPLPNTYGVAVVAFQVARQPVGEDLTEENWDTAEVLRVVPASPDRRYFLWLDDGDGLEPEVEAALAIRPLYGHGLPGPVGPTQRVVPTHPHARAGRVMDDAGMPMAGVTVRLTGYAAFDDPRGFRGTAVTDAEGRFEPLGPISGAQAFMIETDTPDTPSAPGVEDAWFDYRTAPLPFEPDPPPVDIALIPRYGFDPAADGIHDWSTIQFIQFLTRSNDLSIEGTVNRTFRRWPSFPLAVFIPGMTSSDGAVDLAAEVRSALAYWNLALGRQIFVETGDPGSAHITCEVNTELLGSLLVGSMRFVPGSPGEIWGLAVPAAARLLLNPDLLRASEPAQRTARHELAHALGWYVHSMDNDAIMYLSAARQHAKDYEIRILKTLVGLPHELLMTGYEDSYPDFPVYREP